MITLDDMNVVGTLVDVVTGEIIGWQLQGVVIEEGLGDSYVCSVTKDYLKSVKAEYASYIEYVESPIVEVLSYKNKYIPIMNVGASQDMSTSDIPYIRNDLNTAYIWGYMVNMRDLIELNDSFAIQRAMGS